MSKTAVFLSLPARERARVALAVLLDGADAPLFLQTDERRGADLKSAAEELLAIELDARFPYVGTMLRLALEEGA